MRDSFLYKQIPGSGFFEKMLFINSIEQYVIALSIVLVGVLVLRLSRGLVHRRLSDARVSVVLYLIKLEKYIFPIGYVFLVFLGLNTLSIPVKAVVLTIIFWVVGLLFLFDNLGFNVTAVLTGLGVGGIAIALAAQTILGDLSKEVNGHSFTSDN